MQKYVYIDFEYKNSNNSKLTLVCCSFSFRNQTYTYWLYKNKFATERLRKTLLKLRDLGAIFVCFSTSAEARSFMALGMNPLRCRWIDLQIEWKMLTNHHDHYRYGPQLIKGKEKVTVRKDWNNKHRKNLCFSLPEHSLVACKYKMLNVKEDLEYKNKMRQMILGNEVYTREMQVEIEEYCRSDIKDLEDLRKRFEKTYTSHYKFKKARLVENMPFRGLDGAYAAWIENAGIPIDMGKARTLAANVQPILDEIAKYILETFPDIKAFRWNKKENRYSRCEKNIQDYIWGTKHINEWDLTDTGKPSLALDAFTKHYNYKHDFPADCFFAQMIRYLKTNQSFSGLKPKSVTSVNKENLFTSIGSDNRIRPYLNIFRAQSSRFQPKATTFPFLWSAWIRSLVSPNPGKAIIGIDYASQEFFIAALKSKDKNMVSAYLSGDPYLFLAKQAGAIPENGTKQSHPKERGIYKEVTLSISYGKAALGLSKTLTDVSGRVFTEIESQALINTFFKVYSNYKKYVDHIQKIYAPQGRYEKTVATNILSLTDGWTLFGNNPNFRSSGNMPLQGSGAKILRHAIRLCVDRKLKVIFPLHDALYVEADSFDGDAIDTFYNCMKEAFIAEFPDQSEYACNVRLDVNTWSPDYIERDFTMIGTKTPIDIKIQDIYIDDRPAVQAEYKRFKHYFHTVKKGDTNGQNYNER